MHTRRQPLQLSRKRLITVITLLVALLALTACAIATPASVAEQAPAFTLPAANGGDVSLSDYVGDKPVLLYFHMAVG